MSKAITDEELIAALISNGTLKAAAAAVGIGERTLYDRMHSPAFRAMYKAARADLMRSAVHGMAEHLQAAVDTVADIMNDSENNPAVRLQAAQTIINSAAKLSRQLQEDEGAVAAQIENNRFAI